jgi:MFS family permease
MIPILAAPLFFMSRMQYVVFTLILLSVSGFSICRGIAIPGYNPSIGEITLQEERGRFLARLQAINNTATLLLGIVMALMLGRNAPMYIYNLFILIGIISGIGATLIFFHLPEPSMKPRSETARMASTIKAALKRPDFSKFIFVHFFVSFATFMVTPFLILYLKDVYLQPDNMVVFYTVFGSLGGCYQGSCQRLSH